MKAFPGVYRPNSVYALFPFTVPQENRRILQSLGEDGFYDFEKPFPTEHQPRARGSSRIPNGSSTTVSGQYDTLCRHEFLPYLVSQMYLMARASIFNVSGALSPRQPLPLKGGIVRDLPQRTFSL